MLLFHFLTILLIHQIQGERVYTRSNGWTYIIDDNGYKFEEAVSWCSFMGGHLPSIHTKDDMDFFSKVVVQKNSPGKSSNTWMGVKRDGEQFQSFLDGSNREYFGVSILYNYECNQHHKCCALVMSNKKDSFKKVSMQPCDSKARAVCVLSNTASIETIRKGNEVLLQEMNHVHSLMDDNLEMIQEIRLINESIRTQNSWILAFCVGTFLMVTIFAAVFVLMMRWKKIAVSSTATIITPTCPAPPTPPPPFSSISSKRNGNQIDLKVSARV